MRNNIRKILTAVLAFCLVLAALPCLAPVAQAAEESLTFAPEQYNIMLVIDGSGSLETDDKTDPDGMRYELISYLLGHIEGDGHNVGAIVFSGNPTTRTDDNSMRSGLLLTENIIPLDETSPDGRPAADYIYNKIVKTGYDSTRDGTTDIGTAVLKAQEMLLAKQQENGLKSVVLLFTDGKTDLKSTQQEQISATNLSTATKAMHDNGIRLMGLFLNKNGKLPSDEIKGIVCATNGITETDPAFDYSYEEIYDAATMNAACQTMMVFLRYFSPIDEDTEATVYYEELIDEFTIPGVGIEAVSLGLYSRLGNPLPELTVELTRPDGTVLKGSDLRSIGRIGRTFHLYKLVDPMPGKWTLYVKAPAGNKIGYCYTPTYSVFIEAGMNVSPEVTSWHVNKDVTFSGYLAQGGTPVTDPASYREYTCTLLITDKVTGLSEPIDIPNDGSGKFEKVLTLDKYGQFEAKILFTCDELIVETAPVEYLLENEAPTVNAPSKLFLTHGLFQDPTATVDLTPYFNDREDGKNLTVTTVNATCAADAYTLNGTDVELNIPKLDKNTTITFQVADTQGATADLVLEIGAHSVTAVILTVIFIILAILIIIAIVIAVILRSVKPMGSLVLSFSIPDEHGGEHSASLYLGVPNANAPSNTNLGALLSKELDDETLLLEIDMDQQTAIDALRADLIHMYKVRISRGIQLEKGKLTGNIKIVNGTEKVVLFNKSWIYRPDTIKYVLTFNTAGTETDESEMEQVLNTDNTTEDAYQESTGVDSLFD